MDMIDKIEAFLLCCLTSFLLLAFTLYPVFKHFGIEQFSLYLLFASLLALVLLVFVGLYADYKDSTD